MAMKNVEIVFLERMQLAEAGIIEFLPDGMPEPIYTYAAWKNLGFQVRKGEEHIAEFAIWKNDNRQPKPEKDEEGKTKVRRRKMFLGKAYFFKRSQVDPIPADK